MKALSLTALLFFSLFLSGCGGGRLKEGYEEFSAELADRSSLCLTADVRCEYEDKSYDFRLTAEAEEGKCLVKVLSPELIRGLSAELREGESSLIYKEASLETGDMDKYGLSPMTALPTMLRAMRDGHMESFYEEAGLWVYELSFGEGSTLLLSLSPETLIPLHCELLSDLKTRAVIDIISWT